jgi:hypothetical protein
MERFSAKDENGHDALIIQVSKNLDKTKTRLNVIEETLNEVTSRCNELLASYSDQDEIVETVSAAVSAKAQARLKIRLSQKFAKNPMPKSQSKFSVLAEEAEAFLRVAEHHIKEAEAMLPRTEMKM